MFVQATIQCECGCVSRFEIQSGKKSYVCPQCKKTMEAQALSRLWTIMGELSDWNDDSVKDALGYGSPKMRAIALTVADLAD